MPSKSTALMTCRLIVYSCLSYLAVANLILANLNLWNTIAFAVGLSASVLTLVTIPPMLMLSVLRKGAFPCMVVVECIITGLLWLFWLGVSLAARRAYNICLEFHFWDGNKVCRTERASLGFACITFITLLFFNVLIFILAFMVGGTIWIEDISDLPLGGKRSAQQIVGASPQTNTPLVAQLQTSTVGTPTTYYVPTNASVNGQTVSPQQSFHLVTSNYPQPQHTIV